MESKEGGDVLFFFIVLNPYLLSIFQAFFTQGYFFGVFDHFLMVSSLFFAIFCYFWTCIKPKISTFPFLVAPIWPTTKERAKTNHFSSGATSSYKSNESIFYVSKKDDEMAFKNLKKKHEILHKIDVLL